MAEEQVTIDTMDVIGRMGQEVGALTARVYLLDAQITALRAALKAMNGVSLKNQGPEAQG